MGFDVMGEEVYPTLVSGATVVLGPGGNLAGFDDLQDFVARQRLTVLNIPASYWNTWVSHLVQTRATLPAGLRLVVAGSDRVLTDRLTDWQVHFGDRPRWLNAYGPTEATITSTLYEPGDSASSAAHGTVPIGRAIAGVVTYVLGPNMTLVPIGVPGELYIGGAGLARGYVGRPDLTADRFVPDPYSGIPGARLYRTGDRVRWLPDGQLEFLGRVDRQVKVRGYRIEPGEIEAALTALPAVKESVVQLREDTPGQQRLVAYVTPRAAAVEPAHLRGELARQLPEYMLPAAFVTLDALPMTPNGKVDREALPAPVTVVAPVAQPPVNDTERVVAGIWGDVLGLRHVSRHTSFFDLGGHSLQLLQVHSRLRERFGPDLTIVDLFKHPTVSALAQRLTVTQDRLPTADAARSRGASRRALLEAQRSRRA